MTFKDQLDSAALAAKQAYDDLQGQLSSANSALAAMTAERDALKDKLVPFDPEIQADKEATEKAAAIAQLKGQQAAAVTLLEKYGLTDQADALKAIKVE